MRARGPVEPAGPARASQVRDFRPGRAEARQGTAEPRADTCGSPALDEPGPKMSPATLGNASRPAAGLSALLVLTLQTLSLRTDVPRLGRHSCRKAHCGQTIRSQAASGRDGGTGLASCRRRWGRPSPGETKWAPGSGGKVGSSIGGQGSVRCGETGRHAQ